MSKFFTTLRVFEIRELRTTAYQLKTNVQVEIYRRPIVARLQHNVSEHQRDWDSYVQPSMYAYNTQTRRATEALPFNVVVPREWPSTATFGQLTASPLYMQKDEQTQHKIQ